MSADNWTTCPRCAKRREAKLQAMRDEVAAKYGQIPVDEFDELRRQLFEAENTKLAETLREDYEFFGAEDGTVTAEYGCSCRECGLETSFTHEHELPVDAAS